MLIKAIFLVHDSYQLGIADAAELDYIMGCLISVSYIYICIYVLQMQIHTVINIYLKISMSFMQS